MLTRLKTAFGGTPQKLETAAHTETLVKLLKKSEEKGHVKDAVI